MDERGWALAEQLVSARYIDAGRESLRTTANTLRNILGQRRCPDEALGDVAIQSILHQLALMDTNNFARHVGAGEREGRVVAALVRQRYCGFTHGIGRSGDLVSEQPKAAGSSLLYKITNALILDLLRLAGAPSMAAAVVVPMATGMTLTLVLRCVANLRERETARAPREEPLQPQQPCTKGVAAGDGGGTGAASKSVSPPRMVIWPRVDQKTALKCIEAAGLIPVPVSLRPAPLRTSHRFSSDQQHDDHVEPIPVDGDPVHPMKEEAPAPPTHTTTASLFLECHVDDIAAAVEAVGGPSRVACVLSTTSCFAPRLPDNTVAIAQYCKKVGLPYVVNNAYGVQSRSIMHRLDAAQRLGRVDFVVQSGDKNFLVPVGGSVICSRDERCCQAAAALYAGRASMSPIMDLFITALSLGRRGMQALWESRYRCRARLVAQLRTFAQERHEQLLADDVEDEDATTTATAKGRRMNAAYPRNDISLAITMRTYGAMASVSDDHAMGMDDTRWRAARQLGAHLFRSAVTGPRVITPAPTTPTTIAGCVFVNYGMHQDTTPPCAMLVMACGIGMTEGEVDTFVERLRELWPPA